MGKPRLILAQSERWPKVSTINCEWPKVENENQAIRVYHQARAKYLAQDQFVFEFLAKGKANNYFFKFSDASYLSTLK